MLVSLEYPSTTYVVGVDMGGTKTLVSLVRLATTSGGTGTVEPGSPLEIVEREEVPSSAGSLDAVDVIESGVVQMIDRAGTDRPVRAVGVGLAGYLDLDGTVRVAPNAPGLVGIDLRARLADTVGLPVTTENDANCVAIAANHLLAPASGDLVAVTLGTGIGGGIVLDGELVRGAHGFAAEPGHTVIDPSGSTLPLRSTRVLGALRVGLRPPLPGAPSRRSGQRRRRSPACGIARCDPGRVDHGDGGRG